VKDKTVEVMTTLVCSPGGRDATKGIKAHLFFTPSSSREFLTQEKSTAFFIRNSFLFPPGRMHRPIGDILHDGLHSKSHRQMPEFAENTYMDWWPALVIRSEALDEEFLDLCKSALSLL